MDIFGIINEENLLVILAAMAFIIIILIVTTILILIKSIKLKRNYDVFMSGFYEDKNFADIVETLINEVKYQEKKSIDIGKRVALLENNIVFAIQKSAVLRFKAFENKGGDQSFSVALLDAKNNGFVITSIYNDGLSSVYAKEIKAGTSEHRLSEEEIKVLENAKKIPTGKLT